MLRELEKGGIPSVEIGSFPEFHHLFKLPRSVRAYGITWPCGNPYVSHEQELGIRRAILDKALEVLQLTPSKPTTYWPNFGNVIGDLESTGKPTIVSTKDWDWKIR